jgi:hypothetical protein
VCPLAAYLIGTQVVCAMTDPIAELSMQKGPLVPEAIRLKLKAANDKGTFLSPGSIPSNSDAPKLTFYDY